jgi:hypothetical protein
MSFLREAIATLSSTPQQAEDLARGLSEKQLSWKAEPELFSVRENILHLRDIDIEGYEQRIRLILSEDCPAFPDLNGGQLARERDYNAQPVEPALAAFRASRTASVERLVRCKEGDLDRKAEMQGVGVVDLRRLLELWMEHDRGHIADMTELRRAIETGKGPSLVDHPAA